MPWPASFSTRRKRSRRNAFSFNEHVESLDPELPSPSGRGLGEGLVPTKRVLRILREMNPDESGFISRKLSQIESAHARPSSPALLPKGEGR